MDEMDALMNRLKSAQGALADATQRIRLLERQIAFAVCPNATHIHVDGSHDHDDHGGTTFYVTAATVALSNGTGVPLPYEEDPGFWDAEKLLVYPDADVLRNRLEDADDEEEGFRSIFAQKLGIPRANLDVLLEVIWSICVRVHETTTVLVRPTKAEQEETSHG